MRIVAILPMKGHSERVPNKNMRNFGGKPLYHSILNTLLASKYIDEVVINTDSEAIEKDVKANFNRVSINPRPTEIQGDFVSMNKIIAHDISLFNANIYIQTHSTNPLLKTETIDKALKMFIEEKERIDSIFSVTKIQTRLYWENGKAINHNPQELLRTQDLPPVYEENSNFYIFTKESFVNSDRKRIGLKPKMFEVSKLEAIDIDTEEDFKLAEHLYLQNKL